MIDLLVRNARLLASGAGGPLDSPGGDSPLVDVHVDQGRFLALPPSGTVAVEARTWSSTRRGALVSPPYVEPHVHLDSCAHRRRAALERQRHAVGGHRLLGRAQAAADP